MRNLEDYISICYEMAETSTDGAILSDELITWGYKPSVHAWGTCRTSLSYYGEVYKAHIDIHPMLLDESMPEKYLVGTILHELLHTIDGLQNHGVRFVYYARKLETEWGYPVENAEAYQYKESLMTQYGRRHNRKYHLVCESCGAICGKFERACDKTKHPEWFRHTKCENAGLTGIIKLKIYDDVSYSL